MYFDLDIGSPVEILSSFQCFGPFLVKYRSRRNILYADPDLDSDFVYVLKLTSEFLHFFLIFLFISEFSK